MTNTIAFYLGLVILVALGLDFVFNDFMASLFMARKFLELLNWIAFWR